MAKALHRAGFSVESEVPLAALAGSRMPDVECPGCTEWSEQVAMDASDGFGGLAFTCVILESQLEEASRP